MREYGPIDSVQNVVARLPGRASTGSLVLAAHYDSALNSFGATDDGNGVSAILETVRALIAGPALRNDIIVLLTDGEEAGLLGAQAFVEGHRWAPAARVVLNAEGRGAWGPVNMFRTVGASGPLVTVLGRSTERIYATSFTDAAFSLLPNDTDLSVFRDAGMVGMDFANAAGVTHYHTPLDNVDRSDPRSLQHHGAYMLPMARALGDMDLRQIEGPRVVYFDVFGRWLIRYPAAAALPIALVVLLMSLASVVSAVRRRSERLRDVTLGACGSLGLIVGVSVLAMAVWWAIRGAFPEIGGFTHGEPYRSGWILIGIVALSVGAFVAGAGALTRRFGLTGVVGGPLLVWAIGGVVAAALLPGVSFPFAWPTLGAALSLALWAHEWPESPLAAACAHVVLAAPTLVLLAPLAYLVELLLLLDAIAGTVFLAAMTSAFMAVPLSVAWERWERAVPLSLTAVGVLVLAGVTATAGPTPERPLRTTMNYAIDVDTREAAWYSWDDEVSTWAEAYLGPRPLRGARPSLALFPDRWIADAPALDVGEPEVQVLSDSVTALGRRIRVQVRCPEETSLATVALEDSLVARDVTSAGRRVNAVSKAGDPLLSYAAPPSGGFDVAFTVATRHPVHIRVVAFRPGIPETDAPARPSWMMVGGDETMAHRIVSLGLGPRRSSRE
ncbi:MAG: M28 family peptidase [Bacteroidota bacterium]